MAMAALGWEAPGALWRDQKVKRNCIRTACAEPSNGQQIREKEQAYVLGTYKRAEPVFVRGSGCTLQDSDGNAYLDFAAGIAVNCLGQADEGWANAVAEQARTLGHVSNLFHTAPHAELAERLCSTSFADKAYFCNSGAEAVEAAFKFARRYAGSTFTAGENAMEAIAYTSGFHGRTMGSLSLTAKEGFRKPFEPLVPGAKLVPYNDLDSTEEALASGKVCAVFVEPIQGEGGINLPEEGFLKGVRELCDRYGALLVFDEVQCGLGRCGALWAHELFGVKPDMLTAAKPLAGGLPIGATLLTDRVAEAIQPGDHGSTFAGSPVICRAAMHVFDRVSRPEFLQAVRQKGELLMKELNERLEGVPQVVEVRGEGLLVGLQLDGTKAGDVLAECRSKGMIALAAGEGDVVRLAPPLVISEEEVVQGASLLASSIRRASSVD